MKKFEEKIAILVILALFCLLNACETMKSTLSTGVNTELIPLTGEVIVLDTFENGLYWNAVADSWSHWGNTFKVEEFSTIAEECTDWSSEGNVSLKCKYLADPTKNTKTAHYFSQGILTTDWSDTKYLVMDICNPNSYSLSISAYTKSGNNKVCTNILGTTVNSGTHLLILDLHQCTDGVNNLCNGIIGAEAVFEIGICVKGLHSDSYFMIDNIRLIK